MNLFKKILIPSGETKEVTAYESWVVRWESVQSKYQTSGTPEAEVFTNEQDAKEFAKSLKDAFKLIRNTAWTNVSITKN